MRRSMSDEAKTSSREQLEALLASGDTAAIVELVVDLESRATTESARAKGLVEKNDDLGETVRRLKARVKHLVKLVYGRRSEKLTPEELDQLVLAFNGTLQGDAALTIPTPVAADERQEETPDGERPRKDPKKRRPNHPGRTALSDDLERRINLVEVPADECECSLCGEPMGDIGYLDHETVQYVPAHFCVDIERRQKLGCKNDKCLGDAVTADRKDEPKVTTRVGASVLAHLIESKCDDALPLYRQQDQFRRLGFEIPLNTLYSNWSYVLDLLEPVATVTLSTVLGDDIVCIDDTGMSVLDKTKPSGKYRGHLWAFKGTSELVAYRFTQTWKADEIAPWIAAIEGFIQVDDYKGYSKLIEVPGASGSAPSSVKLVPDERRLGCKMHERRRFYDAFKLGDKRAAPALELTRKIYKIEARAKKDGLDADARLALRQAESLPLLAQFYEWVEEIKPTLGKTSKLAEAVRYADNQRRYIERCFTDGRFEIDNGAIERILREPCLGRKNFLHAGSLAGAKRLATAYTLVQSCCALGISTRDYLIDVIEKVGGDWPMRRLCELVPDRWARDRGLLPPTDQPRK